MSRFSGQDLVCIRGERTVFQGLDFQVDGGGALVLTGPNGSGKSSLLRLMAGLLPPAQGSLTWDGRDIGDDVDAYRGGLHYVGHADPVKPVLSVAENLAFWTALRGLPGQMKALEDRVRQALEAFGIGRLADVPAGFLSAGQRRRVNLARLVAAPARLWLLDEPTAALDAAAVAALEKAIGDHRAGGGMVVVSTHAKMALDGARGLDLDDFSGGEYTGGPSGGGLA